MCVQLHMYVLYVRFYRIVSYILNIYTEPLIV